MTDVQYIGVVNKVVYVSIAIWATGLAILIFRLWYFWIQMLNNLAPGASPWSGGGSVFDGSRYNADGQVFHQKLLRLYWKTVAFGVGGLLLIAAGGSLAARYVGSS
jgi:hypothetical protein